VGPILAAELNPSVVTPRFWSNQMSSLRLRRRYYSVIFRAGFRLENAILMLLPHTLITYFPFPVDALYNRPLSYRPTKPGRMKQPGN
jgi:hypothetical protein